MEHHDGHPGHPGHTGNDTSDDAGTKPLSDVDRARLGELRRIAVGCLIDMDAILAPYLGIDPGTATSVTVGLVPRPDPGTTHDGVPPVYPCQVYSGPQGQLYEECDPPGVTRPVPRTLESHA